MIKVTRIFLLLLVSAVTVLPSCSRRISAGGTTGKYSEDLSGLRAIPAPADTSENEIAPGPETKRDPSVYVEARHAINGPLDAILDSISEYNLENGVVDGFTIQVYSGAKREEALNVKKQLLTTVPELEADVQFVQPNFRVRIGKYFNRLEAQQDYLAVKKHFPNAVVIPDRIRFR